jgi:gamma-glutamylcyclotransferase (GGCT)/AIG2-like uncharacterized protein YtfP
MLDSTPVKHWGKMLAMTETRFAIVSPDCSVTRYGVWHEKDGIFYSKSNCFAQRKLADLYSWDWEDETENYSPDISSMTEEEWLAYESSMEHEFPAQGDLVAVYGTLKGGRGNSHKLAGAEFIGKGETVDSYRMIDRGVPYVLPCPDERKGRRITVECYIPANRPQWEDLDRLEGHPDHYCRERIGIELESGETVDAWLYFSSHTIEHEEGELIATY